LGSFRPRFFTSKPFGGSLNPSGGVSVFSSPFLLVIESKTGLKVKSPAIAIAVTISEKQQKHGY